MNKEVRALYDSLPGIAIEQFTNKCQNDEILLTNAIEGIHSTRREIGEILQDLSAHNKQNRFVGLVTKYVMLEHQQPMAFQTCQDIRKVYDDIFYEEIKANVPENLPDGEIFRRSNVEVLSASQKVIHKGLHPESRIIEVFEQSLAILNDESIDIFIRIALFHYLFGYIHPFYAGKPDVFRLYDLLIQAALFSNIGISREHLVMNMELSESTVRSRLKGIPELLLIENRQRGRKYYLLDLDEMDRIIENT